MSVTTGRRRVYGVDFSGAQDAGRHVWLASATRRTDTLFVEGCYPGDALPGSGRDRSECLPALRAFLADADDAAVGLDFPFGLPEALVDERTWTEFSTAFPHGAEDPASWADECRDRAAVLDGERVELKRATDETTGAPFSPYNLRMRAGTFYGLGEVLSPLVADEAVSVLPMEAPNPGRPWLLEACPAVTVERLDVDHQGYKDDDEAAQERREAIVEALEDGPATLAPSVREAAVSESDGDALDAVLAAVGVAQSLERGDPLSPGVVEAHERLEGRIYA